MPPPTHSVIWTYFTLDERDRDSAHCKLCNKKYSRKGRTTTSLKNHLKAIHPEHFCRFQATDNENQLQKKRDELENTTTQILHAMNQISSEEIIEEEKKWDSNNLNSKKIDNLIGEMIALQDLPVSFVEGIGFRRLMQEIAPKYNLRGRNFFNDYVYKKLHEKVKERVKKNIEKFYHVTFTINIWTDQDSNASLLSFTCHGLTENFDRSSITVKCESIDDYHIGDVISAKIDATLSEWNISKEQVHCMIRKKDSKIKTDTLSEDISDLDCTVHKIQLAVQNSLQTQENIKRVLAKCQKNALHFNNSRISQNQLLKIQDRLQQPHIAVFPLSLTLASSTFYMFERFLKAKNSLNVYICIYSDSDMDQILPEEWNIIECCVELLKPFEEATRELRNSQNLISSVIPIIHMLLKKVDNYLTKPHESDPIRLAATTLKTEVCILKATLEENYLFTISTYLDPRFKHKFFKPTDEEKIENEILKNQHADDDNESTIESTIHLESSKTKRMRIRLSPEQSIDQEATSYTINNSSLKNDLAMVLDTSSSDESEETTSDNDPAAVLKKELFLYRKMKRISLLESPLNWWRVNKSYFRMLTAAARRYLSPPSACVPPGHMSSSPGVNDYLPNQLESKKTATLHFLKYNLLNE